MGVLYAKDELISVEDYLQGELSSEIKHEYIDGKVYAMSGASRPHNLIANALAFALTPNARQKGCQLFVANMKVRLDFSGQQVFLLSRFAVVVRPHRSRRLHLQPSLPDYRNYFPQHGTLGSAREALELPNLTQFAGICTGGSRSSPYRNLSIL